MGSYHTSEPSTPCSTCTYTPDPYTFGDYSLMLLIVALVAFAAYQYGEHKSKVDDWLNK
jgi:hypothetical protein